MSLTGMAYSELLESCRSCIHQAQHSWDSYFSKWELMAKNEDIDDRGLDLDESDCYQENTKKKVLSKSRKMTGKYISLSIKNGNGLLTKKGTKKKLNGRKQKQRTNQIIHTTENQTNLECVAANNKHLEADLKAIFAEILSENPNTQIGIFSVLSRLETGTAEFSCSSVKVERRGMFNTSFTDTKMIMSFSRGESPSIGFKYPGMDSCDGLLKMPLKPMQNQTYLKHSRFEDNISIFKKVDCLNRKSGFGSSPKCYNWPEYAFNPKIENSINKLSGRKVSIEDCLNKIFSTPCKAAGGGKQDGILERQYCSENGPVRKRKRFHPLTRISDDEDSDDEGAPDGEFLKIFCTPKRSRRRLRNESSGESREDRDDSDGSSMIIDRCKPE